MNVKKREIIALLNRRVASWKRTSASDAVQSQDMIDGRISELQYILGRITAHNTSIRSMGSLGD